MTTPQIAKHAASSGHFYTQYGEQVEAVPYAASNKTKVGQFRAPSLRDAKKPENQWCRGVTSIIGNSHRPQLENWKITQAVLAALQIDRERGVEHAPRRDDPTYIAEIIAASKEIAKDAADIGTAIHAGIQAHYTEGETVDLFVEPYVDCTVAEVDLVCGAQDWQPEVCVVSDLGYATKIDLLSDEWILDFKSKNGDLAALTKMPVWDSYPMQLVAGRYAAEKHQAKCGVVYVSRDHPGIAVFKQVEEESLHRGWTMFHGLLEYTHASDKYKPAWTI